MNKLRNQKGIALPLVLLFIVVLVLLGFGLSVFGYYEATSAIREEHLARAFYIARGSVAALADYLTNIPSDVPENGVVIYQEDLAAFVDEVKLKGLKGYYNGSNTDLNDFVIEAISTPDPANPLLGSLLLTSTGKSGKFTNSASIELSYSLTEYQPFGLVDAALFTYTKANSNEYPGSPPYSKDYKVDAFGKVVVGTLPSDPNILSNVKVDVQIPWFGYDADGNPYDYTSSKGIVPEIRNYRLPRELVYASYTDKGNQTISTAVKWDNSTDKTVNTIYKCQDLIIGAGGTLYFENAGMVTIIVEGTLDIKGDIGNDTPGQCIVNPTPGNSVYHTPDCWLGRVNIIYNGTGNITIGGGAYIRANIISIKANITDYTITGKGNWTISGNIIAGTTQTINLYGNFEGDSMIYAPNATVYVGGSSGIFNGAIICKEFEPNSHLDLTYKAIQRSSLPLWYGPNATGTLADEDMLGTDEYYVTNLQTSRWK